MKRTAVIRVYVVVLLFILIPVLLVHAQDTPYPGNRLPLWLQMERGIRAYDEGRLGDALKIFRDVAENDSSYANAHVWIGNVFQAEGEYGAALVKYRDSLAEGRNFFPASMRIEALYSLAEVYSRLEEWEEMENTLGTIVREGTTEMLPDSRRIAMLRKFVDEGPDKLLELYRLNDKAVRRAYQMLGELKLREGDYESALEHLMLSLTTVLSLAIETHRLEDVNYLFVNWEMNPGLNRFFTENTAGLIEKSLQVPTLKKYFEDVGLFRQLFLLGTALLGMKEPEKAGEIWLLVTDHREAGIWYEFAQGQITEPDLAVIPLILRYR